MTKSLKNPYVEFVGHNAMEVTGSANLIKFLNYQILIDYGMRQTSNDEEDYKINRKRHKDVKPKNLTSIIITHCHNDHIGMIPALYKDGASCPLYVPKGSKGLITLMWQDSVKIFENDFIRINRTPLYKQEDVDNALRHIIEVDLYEKVNINENICFEYYNAQHIVKSRQIYIELKNGETIKKIGITGDFSSYQDRYFLDDRDNLPYCNLLIGESTYSDHKRNHKESKDRKTDINKIEMAVRYAIENKSKIIIPTFSLDRLELLLAILYDNKDKLKDIKILIDTPLGYKIAQIWNNLIDKDDILWSKIMEWENILWINDFKDSQHFNNIYEPLIVIAGGGMLQGGRAKYWVKENLNNSKNRIMFCGFSTPNSIAGQIRNGQNSVKIDGHIIKNNAQITTLNSCSCHADYSHLIKYYTKDIKYDKIALVHGEFETKVKFSEILKQELSKQNRSSRVICVTEGSKIRF